MTGKIFDIHRLSTHDGPGMRTTVFMKGCSLKCAWCHNPESIHSYDEIQWLHNKCIGCYRCIEACQYGALEATSEGIVIDREKCRRCMACVAACPTGAMNQLGADRNIDEVFDEVMQDQLFYLNSGGGLTISGGEPLLQDAVVLDLLMRAKAEGIHTALDTSLQVSPSAIEKVWPYVDLWLVDMKLFDRSRQLELIGSKDERILNNFEYLLSLCDVNRETVDNMSNLSDKAEHKIWVRTPLIPGATASDKNIRAIGDYLNKVAADKIDLWELCTFNNLCGDKYKKLGLDWLYDQVALLSSKEKADYYALAKAVVKGRFDVKVSGLTS